MPSFPRVRRGLLGGLRLRWRQLALLATAILLIVPPLVSELEHEPPTVNVAEPGVEGPFRLYVADWGYHASIIVEQPPGWRLGPPGQDSARFVEFAWGDRRFYMEANYRPDAVFATLLLPTESVTYVAGWRAAPEQSSRPRALFRRDITASELQRLVSSLESAIRRIDTGDRTPPHPAKRMLGGPFSGRFYPAQQSYLWWNDCNRWVVDRLAAAGLARGGRGVILSGQVAARLRGFRRILVRRALE